MIREEANNQIIPFLWFNDNLEQAIDFYQSIFKDVEIISIRRNGSQVFGASFSLNGQLFHALNGGPRYAFTPAISLFISCSNQEEIDYYWNQLVEGGKPDRCGWLTDRFGLSWQVVPEALGNYLQQPGGMEKMLGMTKFIISEFEH